MKIINYNNPKVSSFLLLGIIFFILGFSKGLPFFILGIILILGGIRANDKLSKLEENTSKNQQDIT